MPCVHFKQEKKSAARSRSLQLWDRGVILGVRVVMVVMAMMVVRGGESRSGKHHQKKGGGEELFHATNVARFRLRWKSNPIRASREERGECSPGFVSIWDRGRRATAWCSQPIRRRLNAR